MLYSIMLLVHATFTLVVFWQHFYIEQKRKMDTNPSLLRPSPKERKKEGKEGRKEGRRRQNQPE